MTRSISLIFFGVGLLWVSSCSTAEPKKSVSQNSQIWSDALRSIGLSENDIRFDELDFALYSTTKRELDYFKAYHREPLRIPSYVTILRKSFIEMAGRLGDLATRAAFRLSVSSRSLHSDEYLKQVQEEAKKPDALLTAIQNIHQEANQPLSTQKKQFLKSRLRSVPQNLQSKISILATHSLRVIRTVKREMKKTGDARQIEEVIRELRWDFERVKKSDYTPISHAVESASNSFDLKSAFAPMLELVRYVDEFEKELAKEKVTEKYQFDWDTPYGRIAIHGAQSDTYRPTQPYLMIIDLGGNDTYYAGGSAHGITHPVSVLIDTAGDDRYLATPALDKISVESWNDRKTNQVSPAFGAGVFGLGLLVDSSGNDLYRTASDSTGRAIFGMGILHDRAGDDTYDCYGNCQGAAEFGIGMLVDGAGRDQFSSFVSSQGYAGPFGLGLLLNLGMDSDVYDVNNRVRDLPFKNGSEHNVSFSQGAGTGWRGDIIDGRSLSGGIGILIDEGGDNRFEAGIMAQGMGYWHGLGILSSGQGNDQYTGSYYAQGTSAHFAVGVLHDAGGDDQYRGIEYQAMGEGRDVGVGFFWDQSGNDTYDAPAFSIGYGDLNGFGIFLDEAGNDTYKSKSNEVLGGVRCEGIENLSLRSRQPTVGIFLDLGGNDRYDTPRTDAGEGKSWKSRVEAVDPAYLGARGIAQDR